MIVAMRFVKQETRRWQFDSVSETWSWTSIVKPAILQIQDDSGEWKSVPVVHELIGPGPLPE